MLSSRTLTFRNATFSTFKSPWPIYCTSVSTISTYVRTCHVCILYQAEYISKVVEEIAVEGKGKENEASSLSTFIHILSVNVSNRNALKKETATHTYFPFLHNSSKLFRFLSKSPFQLFSTWIYQSMHTLYTQYSINAGVCLTVSPYQNKNLVQARFPLLLPLLV